MSSGTDQKTINWYFTKAELCDTPSTRDGIPLKLERRCRQDAARFILDCGRYMRLGHKTIATAIVFLHRFFMLQSMKIFARYVIACSCLFLAGKAEETPKKCRDLMRATRFILREKDFQTFGTFPIGKVMVHERIVLSTLKFDLDVHHPYEFLLPYIKCLKCCERKLQELLQMAWNFANDALCTVICLQWEPEIMAVAYIHLATKMSEFEVEDWTGRTSNTVQWWDLFVSGLSIQQVEDICHQVLDVYAAKRSAVMIKVSTVQTRPHKLFHPHAEESIQKPSEETATKNKKMVVIADTAASKQVGKQQSELLDCSGSSSQSTSTCTSYKHCLMLPPPPPPPPSPVPTQVRTMPETLHALSSPKHVHTTLAYRDPSQTETTHGTPVPLPPTLKSNHAPTISEMPRDPPSQPTQKSAYPLFETEFPPQPLRKPKNVETMHRIPVPPQPPSMMYRTYNTPAPPLPPPMPPYLYYGMGGMSVPPLVLQPPMYPADFWRPEPAPSFRRSGTSHPMRPPDCWSSAPAPSFRRCGSPMPSPCRSDTPMPSPRRSGTPMPSSSRSGTAVLNREYMPPHPYERPSTSSERYESQQNRHSSCGRYQYRCNPYDRYRR